MDEPESVLKANADWVRPTADFHWHWENRNITPLVVDEAHRRVTAGATIEETLRFLRERGANAIDSIIVLRAFFNLSLKDAQLLLHSSETWIELRDRG